MGQKMILIDTGPLVALFDTSDKYHQLCLEIMKKIQHPLVTTWPVITEVFYLLNFSWKVQDNFWEFIQRGGLEIPEISFTERRRCQELMKKYHDLPMDFADASLVAGAETRDLRTIFTLDYKDFSIYAPRRMRGFILLPPSL